MSPQTIGRRLTESGLKKPGDSPLYTIQEIHECLAKIANVKVATEKARLENSEADAHLKRLEIAQKEGTLVPLDEAIEFFSTPLGSVARMLKDLPARISGSANPEDPVLAKDVIQEAVNDICGAIRDLLEKMKKEKL